MAITWDTTITPIDVATKTASIVAVRTDDVEETVETHRIISCILATVAQKTAVGNQLWDMHLAWDIRQAQIEAFVGVLEIQLEANLAARE